MKLDAEIVINQGKGLPDDVMSVEFQMLITAYNLRDGRKLDMFHCTRCGIHFGGAFSAQASSILYPPFQDHFPDCPK